MKVELTARARQRVKAKLASMSLRSPVGTIYRTTNRLTIRRLRLPKTEQHIYYSIDDDNETVAIRTVWGARRGARFKL